MPSHRAGRPLLSCGLVARRALPAPAAGAWSLAPSLWQEPRSTSHHILREPLHLGRCAGPSWAQPWVGSELLPRGFKLPSSMKVFQLLREGPAQALVQGG